jgi:hypothetical protein
MLILHWTATHSGSHLYPSNSQGPAQPTAQPPSPAHADASFARQRHSTRPPALQAAKACCTLQHGQTPLLSQAVHMQATQGTCSSRACSPQSSITPNICCIGSTKQQPHCIQDIKPPRPAQNQASSSQLAFTSAAGASAAWRRKRVLLLASYAANLRACVRLRLAQGRCHVRCCRLQLHCNRWPHAAREPGARSAAASAAKA